MDIALGRQQLGIGKNKRHPEMPLVPYGPIAALGAYS